MSARYEKSSVRISSIIIAPERIFRWGSTRRSYERQPEMGAVVSVPQVGGLHHRYERQAS